MDRDTAVARVKVLMGFKQNLDAEIVQAMIEVQQQLERAPELPGFLRKAITGLVTVADTKTLAVPTDFIREFDADQLFAADVDGFEHSIVKDDQGQLRIRYPVADGTGLPKRYALVDRTIYFYPTPDAAYTLSGTYLAKEAVLSSNIENKWLLELPEIIIAGAGLHICAGTGYEKGIMLFNAMDTAARAKLHLMTVAADAAGSKPIRGGED